MTPELTALALAARNQGAASPAAHRRAAPRHGDLAAICASLGDNMYMATIKRPGTNRGSPHRGPSLRGSARGVRQ